jgi:hypothetical protein
MSWRQTEDIIRRSKVEVRRFIGDREVTNSEEKNAWLEHEDTCPARRGRGEQCACYSPPSASERGAVLDEANTLIHGERNKAYGSPTENFDRIAAFWNVQLERKLKPGERITGQDTALLMISVKLARAINQPKRDNFVDIAGYAACGWEAREEDETQQ